LTKVAGWMGDRLWVNQDGLPTDGRPSKY